jgi:hypothetical protein
MLEKESFFFTERVNSTHLGVFLVRVERTLCDRELDEGVLRSWCSGVVTGPSKLTSKFRHILKREWGGKKASLKMASFKLTTF